MHKFVILIDDSTTEERDAVTKAINSMAGIEWWHWFHYAWLVKDSDDRSATFWRDVVQELIPDRIGVVVLQVAHEDAAYWIHEDGAEWIRDSWSHD